jgi:hypothetical protein
LVDKRWVAQPRWKSVVFVGPENTRFASRLTARRIGRVVENRISAE